MLDKLLQRLPDTYEKSPDSNVGKLLTLPAEQLDDIEENLDRLQDWRDIDQAKGKVLDRIGRNVNISRRGMTDTEFRMMIKIQIISNLSRGDIETINQVAPVLLNGELDSIQEGWTFDGDPFEQEPAAILITTLGLIDDINPIPFTQIERIVAGGVKVYWNLKFQQNINLKTKYEVIEEMSQFYDTNIKTKSIYRITFQRTIFAGTIKAGEELILPQ